MPRTPSAVRCDKQSDLHFIRQKPAAASFVATLVVRKSQCARSDDGRRPVLSNMEFGYMQFAIDHSERGTVVELPARTVLHAY